MAVPGPLTRTVRDARLALSVMARGDPRDTRWAEVPLAGAADALDALARRDLLLWRWLKFLQARPLVVLPKMCDLPPPFGADLTREGQARLLGSMRPLLLAAALGLPALAVPVGSHGALRMSVQILAGWFREDLALDADEAIEAAEGLVASVDPAW